MRRLLLPSLALLLLAYLAVRPREATAPAPRGAAQPVDAVIAPAQFELGLLAPAAAPEVLADRGCVQDLLAVDEQPGLAGVRAAFARGLPGDDAAIATYLGALIADRIGASVQVAMEVLDWVDAASPQQAAVLLEGLSRSEGARDPRVAERLLALGRDVARIEGVRAAALDALRTQPGLDGAGRVALRALALDDTSDAVAWHATRALGAVMAESHARGGDAAPYWDELAEVARTSELPAVRALALEAPMHADTILPSTKIETLLALLPNEPHRDVRELAIFQLGLTDAPEQALEALRRAFDDEYDTCVRWAIVRFAVRAAGERALPLLEHFARVDPTFNADVADFRTLFAAGYQDFEQIWLQLPERHFCGIEDGEPHGGEL